ncbi:MAG: hypothetical protein HYT79_04550 [Elusimicrobia bacterium]|nr:hypothetical protein [Elusimicrobiota bacterium]
MQNIGVISSHVTHGDDLVVLSRKEYERLQNHLRELQDVLRKIRRGEKELRAGKTKTIASLKELL